MYQISKTDDPRKEYGEYMDKRDSGENRNRGYKPVKNYDRIVNDEYESPVVLKHNKKYYVVGGRTRLYAALALGIPAKVKIISVSTFAKQGQQGVAEGRLNEFAPGGNSSSSYYVITSNFVDEFAQQKQEEIQDLIDAGWTKQDLAQAGTQKGAAADIVHFEQVRDGFLKGLKPGFDAYLQGDTQLKDQLGSYWQENDLPLNQDWEKIYGEPWGRDEYDEGMAEDWQKANKRDKTDGMSQKAVNAYRRENPGSKLKTAVTTKPSKLKKGGKASKRRKSYCSRSRGQMKMHSISCAKTPDKAICKARRRWNC
jgi:hypothetical protein